MYDLHLFTGMLHCPFFKKLDCPSVFPTAIKTWKHAKTHGREHFPWVCGICPNKVFICRQSMVDHWEKVHPDIKEAKNVVHETLGSHYSLL